MTTRKKTKKPRAKTPAEQVELWATIAAAFARAEIPIEAILIRRSSQDAEPVGERDGGDDEGPG